MYGRIVTRVIKDCGKPQVQVVSVRVYQEGIVERFQKSGTQIVQLDYLQLYGIDGIMLRFTYAPRITKRTGGNISHVFRSRLVAVTGRYICFGDPALKDGVVDGEKHFWERQRQRSPQFRRTNGIVHFKLKIAHKTQCQPLPTSENVFVVIGQRRRNPNQPVGIAGP